MTTTDITAIIVASVTIALLLYDVWAAVKTRGENEDGTISWLIITESKRFPAIAFGAGLLMGHLFL
jgi:hypothetical protein